jgi:Ca-activated chloride channel homolog
MKVKTVGYLAMLGMLLTSVSVWSLTEPKGLRPVDVSEPLALAEPATLAAASGAEFSAGKTLLMEGRLGQARLLADKEGQTYVLVNVSAQAAEATQRAPLNLAIVIDRSGSMKGKRLANALSAASGMIQRLADGDAVSVVAYNDETEVVVPSTLIDSASRARALGALSTIEARGDTCISCGVEAGQRMLTARSSMVDRVLLLSDGEATVGVKDVDGFRALATRVHGAGASISSIGVDVEYNERVLAALAQESNGRHHFVENPLALGRAFDAELDSLERTVAKDAELTLDLGPGVQIEQVLDRTFRTEGKRVIVPFGTFALGEQKTLLARVRLDRSAEGERPIAAVKLAFADAASGRSGECNGKLSLWMTRDASSLDTLDPLVLARLQRSETAQTLTSANQLFASGRGQVARQRIKDKLDDLRKERKTAVLAAPKARAKELEEDFDRQERALGAASSGFAEPPPAPAGAAPAKPEEGRAGKAQVRANQKSALDLSF